MERGATRIGWGSRHLYYAQPTLTHAQRHPSSSLPFPPRSPEMPRPALHLLNTVARRRLATAAAAAAAAATTAAPLSFQVFDRTTKRLQRDRAGLNPAGKSTDYLKDEVAARLVERLLVLRPPLPHPSRADRPRTYRGRSHSSSTSAPEPATSHAISPPPHPPASRA